MYRGGGCQSGGAAQALRKKGLAAADKKAGRVAAEGLLAQYIHAGSRSPQPVLRLCCSALSLLLPSAAAATFCFGCYPPVLSAHIPEHCHCPIARAECKIRSC